MILFCRSLLSLLDTIKHGSSLPIDVCIDLLIIKYLLLVTIETRMKHRVVSVLFCCLVWLQLSQSVSALDSLETSSTDTQQRRDLLVKNSCYCPSCRNSVLNTRTAEGQYTCKQRIAWLIGEKGESEYDACRQVSGVEFPDECGACNPDTCRMGSVTSAVCARRVVEMCKYFYSTSSAFHL
jgi:hypothetical protein